MKDADPSRVIIDSLDDLDFQILDQFDEIENLRSEKFEERYCFNVGSYGKLLRQLLDLYHEDPNSSEIRTRLKPYLLYYRELQQYLVYFVRFPEAMYQKDHPYMKEMRELIENKEYFIKIKYKPKAIQESMLFETEFREKLEKSLSRRKLSNGS